MSLDFTENDKLFKSEYCGIIAIKFGKRINEHNLYLFTFLNIGLWMKFLLSYNL